MEISFLSTVTTLRGNCKPMVRRDQNNRRPDNGGTRVSDAEPWRNAVVLFLNGGAGRKKKKKPILDPVDPPATNECHCINGTQWLGLVAWRPAFFSLESDLSHYPYSVLSCMH